MQTFTGIDIGGSNVKIGLVDRTGQLLEKKKVSTKPLRESGNTGEGLVKIAGDWLRAHPEVKHIGIGVPGMLSNDRRILAEIVNIPELNGFPLAEKLEKAYPGVSFHLENDANAAALGELYFSGQAMPDNFLLVTLGTGIGSGAVINRKIFTGGDGNALELGHIVSGNGRSVEETIGKAGLVRMAKDLAREYSGKSVLKENSKIDDDTIIDAALDGDEAALKVFAEYGKVLGGALASAIYILDIKSVYIGGGVAKAYKFMEKSMFDSLHRYLSPYYTKNLEVKLAKLGNNAGILGAAALCFMDGE